MDETIFIWNELKDILAAMNRATADVLTDLRRDFCATTEEDIRELTITLQSSAEVVIAGCGHLVRDMRTPDRPDLMIPLFVNTGCMFYRGCLAHNAFRTRSDATQTSQLMEERMTELLEQRVTELQRAVEDFAVIANIIIDEGA